MRGSIGGVGAKFGVIERLSEHQFGERGALEKKVRIGANGADFCDEFSQRGAGMRVSQKRLQRLDQLLSDRRRGLSEMACQAKTGDTALAHFGLGGRLEMHRCDKLFRSEERRVG